MSRLVILGIDALDPVLLKTWQDELPNFSKIMTQGYFARLESTTPPDSIPAWVTIYTGMHPWHHGIIDSVDYLEIRGGAPALDTKLLIGKTFWDKVGDAGRRVCVVNPLLAYPVWPVNGIMVNGPVFVTGEVQAYPPEILRQYELPEMGGMVDFPGKKELGTFIRRTEHVTQDQARFGLELLDREEWDLFFLQFLTLDRVMHFLWRFTDPSDPTFPGTNPFEHSIKDFFKLFDSILGDFLDRLTPGQSLLIVSDHGHAMRPPRAVYVNEMLRRQGLLKTRVGQVPGLNTVALLEKTKNLFLRLMQRLDLEDLTYRIAALIPKDKRKSLKTSAYAVTRENSTAWVSDIGGGTSFSGIQINRALCEDKDYEPLRDRLISLLGSLTDQRGERIVKWAKRREDAFTGPNVGKYPDVVFELSTEYGVDRTLYCGEVGVSSTHKKISGGHSKFGTLLLYGSDLTLQEGDLHISSVFDMIRRILDLEGETNEP